MCCGFPGGGRSLLRVDRLGCQTNAGRAFHTCCSPTGPPLPLLLLRCVQVSGVCLCFFVGAEESWLPSKPDDQQHIFPKKKKKTAQSSRQEATHPSPQQHFSSPPFFPRRLIHHSIFFLILLTLCNPPPPPTRSPPPLNPLVSLGIPGPFLSFPSCVSAPPGAPVVVLPATEVWKLPGRLRVGSFPSDEAARAAATLQVVTLQIQPVFFNSSSVNQPG